MDMTLDRAAAAKAEEALALAQQLASCGDFVPRPFRGWAFVIRRHDVKRSTRYREGLSDRGMR